MAVAKSWPPSAAGPNPPSPTPAKASCASTAHKTEFLFVTLDKSEKRFSPTTSYEDYAISPTLFHWQSQSQVSPDSPTGRRYIDQRTNNWRYLLFVRPTVRDVYTYLGPARYLTHTGTRPMSITWQLDVPIPGRWLSEYVRLAA